MGWIFSSVYRLKNICPANYKVIVDVLDDSVKTFYCTRRSINNSMTWWYLKVLKVVVVAEVDVVTLDSDALNCPLFWHLSHSNCIVIQNAFHAIFSHIK
jgi:hypothetical protein